MEHQITLNVPSLEYCKSLPKVELHAHINGSTSDEMLQRLIHKKRAKEPLWGTSEKWQNYVEVIKKGKKRTMAECFQIFQLLHELCDREEVAQEITRSVIKDFADDNVKYLELRTTPRRVDKTGMTKRSYTEAVLKGVNDSLATEADIIVRLLLSIDRRTTVEDAEDTVNLALEYREKTNGLIVGIDLSGDPNKGDARLFAPVLQRAQREHLKLAMHLAEVSGYNEETTEMLKIIPDRIGHGTFLTPDVGGSEALVEVVKCHQIPLEVCLSSNVCTETVASYEAHHVGYWLSQDHPICPCTDDKGIFATTLSQEYHIMAESFKLSNDDLYRISKKSLDCIFAGESVKQDLTRHWEHFQQQRENH